MERDLLVEAAWQVREAAYAPYSDFRVGAAVLSEDGRVFTGCNVENISYGLTQCAERVAIGTAVAAGVRIFREIVVVADTAVPISPCGACRQVMAEFGVPVVVLVNRRERLEFRVPVGGPAATRRGGDSGSCGIVEGKGWNVPRGTIWGPVSELERGRGVIMFRVPRCSAIRRPTM